MKRQSTYQYQLLLNFRTFRDQIECSTFQDPNVGRGNLPVEQKSFFIKYLFVNRAICSKQRNHFISKHEFLITHFRLKEKNQRQKPSPTSFELISFSLLHARTHAHAPTHPPTHNHTHNFLSLFLSHTQTYKEYCSSLFLM